MERSNCIRKNTRRRISAVFIFLSFICFCCFSSCVIKLPQNLTEEYTPDPSVKAEFTVKNDMGLAKAQLTSNEAQLYDIIDAAVKAKTDTITDGLDVYSVETIEKVYGYVIIDHPEYFWARESYQIEYTSGIVNQKTLMPAYINYEDVSGMTVRLESERDRIIDTLSTLPTDYDKILYIHDYLVSEADYDTYAYENIDSSSPSQDILASTTAYGAIVNKKAICSGYSKAMQYLAEAAGIRSTVVTGYKNDGESHMWNFVILDGAYYYIDVTWDDPVFISQTSNDKNNIFYNYFCMNSAELMKTHSIDGKYNIVLPECTEEKYNYFIYNNLYLDSYTFDDVSEIIGRAFSQSQKYVQIKFSMSSAVSEAASDLFSKGKIFDLLSKYGHAAETASYSIDDTNNILMIDLEY